MAKTKAAAGTNAFIGKQKPPTKEELSAALGSGRPLWEELLKRLARELNLTESEWNTYSIKAGWSLRVKCGDRIVVYLAPVQDCFRASFALGDKARRAALSSDLSKETVVLIANAKKYAEGTAVRIDVRSEEDLALVVKLARAKLEN
jgi:xanthine/CO dehydrogenase XdhC/CoxF family maturation factor